MVLTKMVLNMLSLKVCPKCLPHLQIIVQIQQASSQLLHRQISQQCPMDP